LNSFKVCCLQPGDRDQLELSVSMVNDLNRINKNFIWKKSCAFLMHKKNV
jgi:hypothetical protein